MAEPGELADELEKALAERDEIQLRFLDRRGSELVAFLRDANRALDEGDWG